MEKKKQSPDEGAATQSDAVPAKLENLIDRLRALLRQQSVLPPERELAETLQVKRYTLRKALQILRELGEIEPAKTGRRAHLTNGRAANGTARTSTAQSGRIARSTNPLEVMEMRMLLEPALARLAALRASPVEIERIIHAAKSPAGMSPSEADQRFHRAIAAGSRNSLASELHVLLHQVQNDSRLRFADSDSQTTPERVATRDAEHAEIARAIAERNPDLAEKAMWEHLAVVQRKIISRLGVGSVDAA